MKQLLFLLLFPCLALAQYPSNAGQKINLGEQTTADGLVFRGLAADTTRKPSVDTMAYILLDTNTNIIWQYKKATNNAWTRLNLLPSDTTSFNYVNTYGTQTVNGDKTFISPLIVASTVKIHKGLANDNESIAIGDLSLNSTTTGIRNTAFGQYALQNMKTGERNLAFGQYTENFDTAGSNNTAIGWGALFNNLSGSQNMALGYLALYDNINGSSNTAIGYLAGGVLENSNTTGSNNTFIGNQAIGASATASNVITLGNSSIATIRAQVTTITSLSDIRDKTDVTPLNYGMNFIDKLKPVSFVWDMRDGGKIGVPEIGFIAQDLQQAQIDTGINIPNLVSGVDEKLEASYGVLLPIIVKALQEANDKIIALEQRIINLENK